MRRWLQERETGVLVGALLVLALSLAYWRTISTFRAPYRLITDLPIPAWVDRWYAYRWIVRGAMLAAAGAMAWVELVGAGLSRRLSRILAGRWSLLGLLGLLTLAGRSYLLAPGRLILGDAVANVANAMTIKLLIAQGHWPPYYWSNFAFMGYPWLQFHNSLFYYQAALAAFVVGDAFLASKLVLLANLFLAAVAMFAYVRFLTRSAWPALVSATVWSATFFHYHFFVHVGSIHISSLLPFIPAALLCVEAILARHRTRLAIAGLAFSVCWQTWAHAFYAAVTVALLCLYVVVRLLLWRRPRLRWVGRLRLLLAAGGGVALGLAGAVSQWLPVYVERQFVGGWTAGSRFSHPIIDWRQVLTFRGSFLTPEWWGGYVGLSVFSLALLGILLSLVLRDFKMFGLVIWLLVAAYLALGPRYLPFDSVMSRLPFGIYVYAIRTPGKYLLWVEFSLAALAGVAVREVWLGAYRVRRRLAGLPWPPALLGRRFALAAVAAVAGEMIFFSLQVNSLYPASWVSATPGYGEALQWIKEHGDRVSRLLDTSIGDLEAFALSGQPAFDSHNEESPPSTALYREILDSVDSKRDGDSLSPAARDGMYLLDVGYVVSRGGLPPDSVWMATFRSEPFGVWQVYKHSPVVAAPQAAPIGLDSQSSISDLIEAMKIDRQANTAAFIPVANSTEVGRPPGGDAGPLRLTVEDYQVGLTHMSLTYNVSQPAVLQLSYSAYPTLELYLDGARSDYFNTAFNLIGLITPAGEHRIELRPVLSPLRLFSYGADIVGLTAIALLFTRWRSGLSRKSGVPLE